MLCLLLCVGVESPSHAIRADADPLARSATSVVITLADKYTYDCPVKILIYPSGRSTASKLTHSTDLQVKYFEIVVRLLLQGFFYCVKLIMRSVVKWFTASPCVCECLIWEEQKAPFVIHVRHANGVRLHCVGVQCQVWVFFLRCSRLSLSLPSSPTVCVGYLSPRGRNEPRPR